MVVGIPPLLSYFVQPVIETACRLITCHVVQALVLLQKPQADEVLERLLRWIEVAHREGEDEKVLKQAEVG